MCLTLIFLTNRQFFAMMSALVTPRVRSVTPGYSANKLHPATIVRLIQIQKYIRNTNIQKMQKPRVTPGYSAYQ